MPHRQIAEVHRSALWQLFIRICVSENNGRHLLCGRDGHRSGSSQETLVTPFCGRRENGEYVMMKKCSSTESHTANDFVFSHIIKIHIFLSCAVMIALLFVSIHGIEISHGGSQESQGCGVTQVHWPCVWLSKYALAQQLQMMSSSSSAPFWVKRRNKKVLSCFYKNVLQLRQLHWLLFLSLQSATSGLVLRETRWISGARVRDFHTKNPLILILYVLSYPVLG